MNYYLDTGETRKSWDHFHSVRPCTVLDLFKVNDKAGDTEKVFLDKINDYLGQFAAPVLVSMFETIPDSTERVYACFHCGEHLTGMMSMIIGKGGFTWGIAHGEGHCSGCGWPARAYHSVRDEDGELMSLRFILQYLPDFEAEALVKANDAGRSSAG